MKIGVTTQVCSYITTMVVEEIFATCSSYLGLFFDMLARFRPIRDFVVKKQLML